MGAGLMRGIPGLTGIALLLLALGTAPLSAMEPSINGKEVDLLKSWGFNISAQGLLKFEAEVDELGDHQPWSPEQDELQFPEVLKTTPHIVQPVVISSKQPREE